MISTANIFLAVGLALMAYATYRAFKQFWRKRQSGPENAWQNEHHIAMTEENSWVENDQSVNHDDSAPARYV